MPKKKTVPVEAPLDEQVDDAAVTPADSEALSEEAAPESMPQPEPSALPADGPAASAAPETENAAAPTPEPPTPEPPTEAAAPAEPEQNEEPAPPPAAATAARTIPRRAANSVLTIESHDEAVLPGTQAEVLWHELTNAYLTHRILSGTLGGVERIGDSEAGLAVVYYKGQRVAIPLTEMIASLNMDHAGYVSVNQRLERLVNSMMGCEVDFIIRGLDAESHSIVASRKDAMLRKQQIFYLTPTADGQPQIYEGRIVQARVVAVAEKSIRLEVFGVECSVLARDLSWEWISDAHELYTVGDVILARISRVNAEDPEHIRILADPRALTPNKAAENLKSIRVQSRYAGTVTETRRGIIYIRLHNGVNAIAHNCLDDRMPAKKDQVSFVVTHVNAEQSVAIGLITRIIRQST